MAFSTIINLGKKEQILAYSILLFIAAASINPPFIAKEQQNISLELKFCLIFTLIVQK